MKILQINTVYAKGSTGRIAQGIHDICQKHHAECVTAYRYPEQKGVVLDDTLTVSSWWDCHIHNRLARYTGLQGCFSRLKTRRFLKKVKKFDPDIIHLHNLHGNYINLPLLFRFIKKHKIKTVWTLHDCWTFTGQCAYFTIANCNKWKAECRSCPQFKSQKSAVLKMHENKRKWFLGIDSMTLVTPSKWLNELVSQSFLKDYSTVIIQNGIDLSVFSPTESDFREKYNIPHGKKILLGVAFVWDKRKGLDVFLELFKRLDKEKYQIVLIGTTDAVDSMLPEGIISIHRTNNQKELAEIYTAADLFVNPTREEMFGLVNVEANACGTPVLTFRTGGSPECIDETSGAVVDCDDIDAMEKEIIRICSETPYSAEACRLRAEAFDMNEKFEEYIRLYEQLNR